MSDAFAQAFKDEARELLADLEEALLEMEENPDDLGIVGRVFRTMHTIKGSGAMFGFDDVASFTHNVETVYDLVRNGELAVSKELVNLSLAARDCILDMLESAESGTPADLQRNDEVIRGFRALVPEQEDAEPKPGRQGPPEEQADPPAPTVTYRIRFRPEPEIFTSGGNPLTLLRELQELGPCNIVANTCEMRPLDALDPELCYMYWDVILSTSAGRNAIDDVFIFMADSCELSVAVIDDGTGVEPEAGYKKLGEILVERGDLTKQQMQHLLGKQKKFGELALEAGMVDAATITSALVEQQHVKEIRQERHAQTQTQEAASSIRVSADKLDLLVNLVGELVTVQARLSLVAQELKRHTELVSVAEEVERLTNDLRDNALDIRMLPIGATFSKFKRLVRDLSAELGKEIELTTEGADTELDKTVIEKLNDPLVHIIRNSIDHGVETPEQRLAKGKPRVGSLHLAAVHSGDSVLITIRDDGAGLNVDAIRAKAMERKIIPAGAELSDREIWQLIFAPGFSTAAKVTSVSGRGVGMDVVKQAIEGLRGSIDVKSEPDRGTSITLKIPLTLAIIESLLVQIGKDRFVMPLAMVDECILLTEKEIEQGHGRDILLVREKLVPYVPLRKMFRIEGKAPAIQQVVICQLEGKRVGLVVDWVIGEHQTVIKSLGRMYQQVEGMSGATILGDGSVALILDIPAIFKSAEEAP
ncbi:chemotaxis protein CheA [Geomonas sp. Red69]|uniref:Chemotaxis protein CheA n=1 Tax=Geomonas diazotrophica TaxID=2843197 RepID=A0ABX8JQ10_9BACT|nr:MULTISPECIES: chemotaxis protein CheA [Geomonas]MBU5638714.1 chemotaxis protein CheA [Geomonas diazotrophica]QWV98709.1 chemotaxis protein CheA [Geomonas nitrogeniifigens]QXE87866.1 chemotaxis protein CheA [Geomonas nitrogeniifigens]